MKKIRLVVFACLFALIFSAVPQTNSSVAAFSKSYESEAKKEYAAAIQPLLDVYDNQSYEMNLRLGWLYYLHGQYNESMIYYRKAMELMPYAVEAKSGYVYPLAALGEYDKLTAQYNKILEINPLDINANYQLGFYYYNRNNTEEARKYFETINNLYPSGYEPYMRAAWAKITGAKPLSDKAATAFAKSYEAENRSDPASAIAALKEIYDPQYYDVNLRLGWLCYLSKLYRESMAYYQVAIDLKPASVEPRFGYVYPASALGNWDNVALQYAKILSVDPKNSYANYGQGMISYNKKDYKAAYPYFEKVVNLYPFDYDGLLMYAWTNLRTGKTREAQILFTKVLMHTPGDKSALEGLSLIK